MSGGEKSSASALEESSGDSQGRQSQTINRPDDIEAQSRHVEEKANLGIGALHQVRSRTRSQTDETLIEWEYNDPENPYNWSTSKKTFIAFIAAILVMNSTLGSSLPSMAIPFITEEFGVTDQMQFALPISIYLIGFIFGPVVWAPLSEHIGRRLLSLIAFVCFTLLTMACGFAPNWPAFLILRFFCGVCGSTPAAVFAGLLADIYGEPKTRGRAVSIFMVVTVWAPLFAPIISGYCSTTIGWRWSFWVGTFVAVATLVLILFLPETYGPILLQRRAKKMRKEDPTCHAVSPRDLEETDMAQLFTVVLARPLRMLFSEPMVACVCAYVALIYAIFYMSFQAFPIIFSNLYGLSPGISSLCYLPIGVGSAISLPMVWAWDSFLAKHIARGTPWTMREESRRLPLALIGGPIYAASLFWLGWSARHSVSFVVPMLAGIPFGLGFLLIFTSLLNYLTDAYDLFAASANAASTFTRSIFGVLLPLATTQMFDVLGISGACSLLGGITSGMCLIMLVFFWKGPAIRAKSPFSIVLRERREALARKAEEDRQRMEKTQGDEVA